MELFSFSHEDFFVWGQKVPNSLWPQSLQFYFCQCDRVVGKLVTSKRALEGAISCAKKSS